MGPGYRVALLQGLHPAALTGSRLRVEGEGELVATIQSGRAFSDQTSLELHVAGSLRDWGADCVAPVARTLGGIPGSLTVCTLPAEQSEVWAQVVVSGERTVVAHCGGRWPGATCALNCERALAGVHTGSELNGNDPIVEPGVSLDVPLDFVVQERKPGESVAFRHEQCDLLVQTHGTEGDVASATKAMEQALRSELQVEGEIEQSREGEHVGLATQGKRQTTGPRAIQVFTGYQPMMQWLAMCTLPNGEHAPCDTWFDGLAFDPAITVSGLERIDTAPPRYESSQGEPRYRVEAALAPAIGATEPLVTLVAFSDFECPFCARAHETLRSLVVKYPDTLRVVFRHNPLPFHAHAKLTAEASMEVFEQRGDQGFFAFADKVFRNRTSLERDALVRYAGEVGADVTKVQGALDQHSHAARVEQDMGEAVRLSARGTPSFFINGRSLRGAQPQDKFEQIIDEEIRRSREVMLLGVERKSLYATAMQGALERGEQDSPAAKAKPPDVALKVSIGGAPGIGPRDALVTVVEVADFQCPFCKRAAETMRELRAQFPKDVRLVFMHNPLPFHADAALAAEAAIEAQAQRGDEAFFRFHDALFERAPDRLKRADLEAIAAEQGLDVARFKKALDERRHKARVTQDQAQALRVGATGTPSFFVNGYTIRGAQPLPVFVGMVERERARAEELVKQGTRPDKVYEVLQKSALESPPPTEEAKLEKADLTLTTRAPSLGPKKAPVSVVMFTDFECPFCSRVRPTLDALRKRFGKQVRLEYRHYPLPFHTHAALAAEAAQEVFEQLGDEAFWQYHDALFDHQQELERADLERHAMQIKKLDMARFRRVLDEGTHRDRVLSDMRAISDAGVRIGTPSFFINGWVLQGAQPLDAFVGAVERAQKENSP